MQGFKKLALVAAIAAIPAASFAMQPMAEQDMSGVTGQDGIDISITTGNLTMNQVVYDRDGISGHNAVAGGAGAIVITGMGVNTQGNAIKLSIDAGQSAAGVGMLNVNLQLTGNTTITTGDLTVASTNDGTDRANMWNVGTQSGTILSSSNITIGATSLNIQLGSVAQTMSWNSGTVNPMILLSGTTVTGGILIDSTTLADNSTSTISGTAADTISITNTWIVNSTAGLAPGSDLTVGNVGINVTANGLEIGIGSIGDATNGLSVYQERVTLGGKPAIGDVAITGLNLSNTFITVAGH